MACRFLLVPGAGGVARYWYRVEPLLREAGHETFAVDLPNWPGATFADHAQAITAAARGADEVVLVAQSMGAFGALPVVDPAADLGPVPGQRHDPGVGRVGW